MVAVDDVLNDSIAACINGWFQEDFKHPFLDVQYVGVPDAEKPIPKRWVEDAEVMIDGFGTEDGDILGEAPPHRGWDHEEGKARLKDALARLNIGEEDIHHNSGAYKMSRHDLATEKRRVKQELKRYDVDFRQEFRRLPTHTEKEPMRPLYVYYRRLKTMITQAEQGRGGGVRRSSATALGSDDEGRPGIRESIASIADLDDGGGGARGASLKEQIVTVENRIDMLQSQKASVRVKLQSFQEKFVSENSRKIRFHKDILPIEREYRMYKTLKEDIMKAETQLRELKTQASQG